MITQPQRNPWHALLKHEHDEIVARTGRPVTQEPRQKRTGSGTVAEDADR